MFVEVFDDDAVDAGIGQRFQLVAQVGDAGRRLGQVAAALGEIFARMRLEGHHGGFQPERRRSRSRAPTAPGARGGHRRSCRS
jgi:hypothetical protein